MGRASGVVGDNADSAAHTAVKLYPFQEKTPRGTFQPGVLFPDEARAYFLQYANLFRPAILRHAVAQRVGSRQQQQSQRAREDAARRPSCCTQSTAWR
jgi:hypothetical protein